KVAYFHLYNIFSYFILRRKLRNKMITSKQDINKYIQKKFSRNNTLFSTLNPYRKTIKIPSDTSIFIMTPPIIAYTPSYGLVCIPSYDTAYANTVTKYNNIQSGTKVSSKKRKSTDCCIKYAPPKIKTLPSNNFQANCPVALKISNVLLIYFPFFPIRCTCTIN